MPPFSSCRERAAIASASSFLEGGSHLAIPGYDSRHHRNHRLRVPAISHHPDIDLFANAEPGTHGSPHSHARHFRHRSNGNRRRPHRHPGSHASPYGHACTRHNPGTDGHANSDSYSYTHSDADPDTHSVANCNPYTHTRTYADSYPDCYTGTYANSPTDPNSDTGTYAHATS